MEMWANEESPEEKDAIIDDLQDEIEDYQSAP
jgi:hypothetical protein